MHVVRVPIFDDQAEADVLALVLRVGLEELRRRDGKVPARVLRLVASQIEALSGADTSFPQVSASGVRPGHRCEDESRMIGTCSAPTAASMLGLGPRTVARWCASGRLDADQPLGEGTPWRISLASVRGEMGKAMSDER